MRTISFLGFFRALGRRVALALALLLSGGAVLGAQDPSLFAVSGRIDWTNYVLEATISLDVAKAGLRLPSGRAQAASMIEDEAPRLLRERVLSLQADSRRSLAEAVASGDLGLEPVTELLEAPRALKSSFSDDLRYFRSQYSVPLLGILSLMVKHSHPASQALVLDYRPTKAYTGIVVYVPGPLPVHGEFKEEAFRPCFFPRIYDERMDLVYERNMAEPAAARAEGIVGYRQGDDEVSLEDRVGGEPLRILAIGLFGSGRGDLLISREDALLIRASEANRALLAAGKVAIVAQGTIAPF